MTSNQAGDLPALVVGAYAIPFLGGATLLFSVQFFYLKFTTDVLLLSPVVIGTVFGLSKLIDAVTDPLVGSWSDRTVTRFGRRSPWLYSSTPFMALCFFLIWSPPDLGEQGLTLWVSVAVVCFYLFFTAYNIPHFALGAELCDSSHGKTRLYGARQMIETVGMLIAFAIIHVVSNDVDSRSTARMVTAGVALVAIFFLLSAPLFLSERDDYRTIGGRGMLPSIRDVFRNRFAVRLLIAWWFVFLGMSSMGIMGPYAAEYILGRPDLIAILPATFVIASFLSIPVWIWLSGRFGKSRVWMVSLLCGSVFLSSLLLTTQLPWFLAVTALAGVFFACPSVVGPSILADVIDHDHEVTMERKEGVYSSMFGLVGKFGAAFVTMLIGYILGISGYVPNEVADPSVQRFLLLAFIGIPITSSILCVLCLRDFSLA